MATIIGQPTGERLNLTGENMGSPLPLTRLSLVTAMAVYTTACGNGDQVGVQPDYFIPFRMKNIEKGYDAELTFLKELIKKENRSLVHQ